ncbi:MAG TPA: CYTH domain-containing protein [Bacteroidales bacterium]|nr:CYTH domain-containing protein [Bacteroidales bacterium]
MSNKNHLEIERKFLVDCQKWLLLDKPKSIKIIQGYISKNVRVRITDNKAMLTIKGKRKGISRLEFEYVIPLEDAELLIKEFTKQQIFKKRFKIFYEDHLWEIDEFEGENEGLILAEVELEDKNEYFKKPSWVSEEVTYDKRYYNVYLAKKPYKMWDKR